MALIVEDGTGLPTANSYVTLEEADAYFADLGSEDWYADPAAIINATQAVDLLYSSRFRGSRLTQEQALAFPRSAFADANGFTRSGIPTELKKAVFELALLHLQGVKLIADPDPTAHLERLTQKLGDLEVTKEFGASVSTSKLRKVGLLLAPILKNGSGSGIKLVRG